MTRKTAFELWLEFEHCEQRPEDDATNDFFNMQVWLPDGRKYALNVWTFKFLESARYPWPYKKTSDEPAKYLLPPDLFVERLDRQLLEQIVEQMLAADELKSEWLIGLNEEELKNRYENVEFE